MTANQNPDIEWPNEAAMRSPVRVLRSVRYDWEDEDETKVYKMKVGKRGRCVIISNKDFKGPLVKEKNGIFRTVLSTRDGTEKDEERLTVLFTQLHFEVTLHTNKTAKEMQVILQKEALNTAHHQAACFVCVVCSHGTNTGLYGTDGEVLSLDKLTSCMDGGNCSALRKKPKLFFIQACQGEDADKALDVKDSGQDLSATFEQLNVTDSHKTTSTVSSKVDMLIACATHPGYVSFRNTQYGSWFIQALIDVFQRHAHEEDVNSMLTMVNNLVSKGRRLNNGTIETQACQFHSSLTRKLFFWPGVLKPKRIDYADMLRLYYTCTSKRSRLKDQTRRMWLVDGPIQPSIVVKSPNKKGGISSSN